MRFISLPSVMRIKSWAWLLNVWGFSDALSCVHVSPEMLVHQESCMNSDTHLELTVMSWQQAQTVCPGEPACVFASALQDRLHHFIIFCTQNTAELCSPGCLHFCWTGALPVFLFLCIPLFAWNTHLISTLRSPLTHTPTPPPLPPPRFHIYWSQLPRTVGRIVATH